MPKYLGKQIFSHGIFPEVGEKQKKTLDSIDSKNDLFFHIPSGYAKIWRETNFQSRDFPRSGWKAEDVEKRKKVGENNGQLRFVRHQGWRTQARLDQQK